LKTPNQNHLLSNRQESALSSTKKIIQKETGDEDRRLGWAFGLNRHFGSVISVVKKLGFGK
jgi:hypothetical protein